jgi:hypothetical protein
MAGSHEQSRGPVGNAETTTSTPRFLQDLYIVPSRAGGWSQRQNFSIPLPPQTTRGEHITITIIPIEAGAKGEMNASGSVHVRLKPPYLTAR